MQSKDVQIFKKKLLSRWWQHVLFIGDLVLTIATISRNSRAEAKDRIFHYPIINHDLHFTVQSS